jgi:hypothetical protein
MVSQAGALVGLVAVAALHLKQPKEEERDLHFEAVLNQTSTKSLK